VFVWVIVFAGEAILANTKIGEFVFHQHPDSSGRMLINRYCIMMATIRHIVLIKW